MEWKMEKIMVKLVATTSLPVDRLTATDCNAAARAKIEDEEYFSIEWVTEVQKCMLINV